MDLEKILEPYLKGTQTGEDNKLRATIGQLSANRSKELTDGISKLQKQVAESISLLMDAIGTNTTKIITSNKELSDSNIKYARQMKWLTFALVLVGIAQVIADFIKK